MGKMEIVERDERTEAIENASYKLGYQILAYGILVDIMLRAFRFAEAPWDLFALVIFAGLVLTVYQWRSRILTSRWVKLATLAFAIALAVGVVLVALRVPLP